MSEPSPSKPSLDRRLFLRAACGGGLILGLGGLAALGWAEGEERPEDVARAWADALKRMKALQQGGVAVVVPKDAAARAALGRQLQALIPLMSLHEGAPPMARALLSQVWVCASAEQVEAKPGETLVLLDPAGKRVAGVKLDLGGEAAAVLKGIRALSEGEGRLAAQVARIRADKALAQILDDLASTKPKQRQSAYAQLDAHVDALAPALFALLESTSLSDEVRANLSRVLARAYFDRIQAAEGLPYGARFKVEVDTPEPCPPCGMAAPSVSGRTFLDFFTRGR